MERIIPNNESLTVEFKSDLKKYPDSDIFEAVVAFANTEGGSLFLGVEDNGEITGVHELHKNPITLSAYIANNTVPPVSIRAEIIDEEKPVLQISVSKSYSGIVAIVSGKILRRRLKADGQPENTPMYPSEIATRLSDLRLLDYSTLPLPEASTDDFDPLELIAMMLKLLLDPCSIINDTATDQTSTPCSANHCSTNGVSFSILPSLSNINTNNTSNSWCSAASLRSCMASRFSADTLNPDTPFSSNSRIISQSC